MVKKYFNKVVATANAAARHMKRDGMSTIDTGTVWGSDSLLVKMWETVENRYGKDMVERWIAYDFEKTGPFCESRKNPGTCDDDDNCPCEPPVVVPKPGPSPGPSTDGGQKNPPSFSQIVKLIQDDIKKYKLAGIMYDAEEGATINGTTDAVGAMSQAVNRTSVKLAWTSSLGNAKNSTPGGVGKRPWDYCLGQAYTDDTTDLYDNNCNNFWDRVKKKYLGVPPNRGVPMVCGSGNCLKDGGKCMDERLPANIIENLIDSRPPATIFQWRNFGIWYGSGTELDGCTQQKTPICSNIQKITENYTDTPKCSRNLTWLLILLTVLCLLNMAAIIYFSKKR
jgi:hypothetical protein